MRFCGILLTEIDLLSSVFCSVQVLEEFMIGFLRNKLTKCSRWWIATRSDLASYAHL